jgi:GWxTD domain-containing protein
MKIQNLFLAVFLCVCLLVPGQKTAEKDLAEKYRDWLKLVNYIILPVERSVFLSLTSGMDRDVFIKTFWKQRDPTPETPENEYRDENARRFAHVNKFFKRGTSREGWMTDMGRIYMILGEPQGIQRFEALGVFPCQAWSYYGDPRKDLPTQFVLLFFQKGGAGEYKLYDPVSDGPSSLITSKMNLNPTDFSRLYEKLYEVTPTLADAAFSIIPGEFNYGSNPPARNSIVMAQILESPKKDINPSYATHFMNYRGIVSTEYMTNFVESDSSLAVIRDPVTGLDFLHFTIAPKNLSVDLYEPKSQYFCGFHLDVSLRVKDDIIFQYSREMPFYFPEADYAHVYANGVSVEDSFPVIEGTYKVIILLQNSVSKEFSLLEQTITVPPDPGTPRLVGPLIGYRFQNLQKDVHIPFKVLDKKILIDSKNTLAADDQLAILVDIDNMTEELRQGGEVRASIKGLRPTDPVHKEFSLKLSDYLLSRVLNLDWSMPVSELAPDYYELKLSLVDAGGRILDEKSANFIVSTEKAIGHPIANSKPFALSNQYVYVYMLATMYDKIGNAVRARSMFEKAYALNPQFREGVAQYGNFLIKTGDYDKVLEIVETLKPDDRRRFDYYFLKGRAHMGKGNYGQAILNLQEGNWIYNSDTRLLNALGQCYQKAGRKKEALEAFKASITLNPQQPDIRKLISQLEK